MRDEPEWFRFPRVQLPPTAALSPSAAISFLVGQLVPSGHVSPQHVNEVIAAVLRRETLGSTNIGCGIAVPHAKDKRVHTVGGIIGESAAPITWPGSPDGGTVRLVCLFVSPADKPGTHLRVLESVSRMLRDEPAP
jgi:PTS system fructose-specific IIA component/PTS system nitrogen regulatory IIA component